MAPRTPLKLLPTEAHVWLFDLEGMNREEVRTAALRLTTAEERARADRFVHVRDRLTHIGARALSRTLLSAYCGLASASAVAFTSNPFGKPVLNLPEPGHSLSFNLSHTRGLLAFAVASGRDVGIDVEALRDAPLEIVGRSFAPPEIAAIRGLPLAARSKAFFDLWTLKESFIKARGLGLSLALDSFACSLTPPALLPYGIAEASHGDWQFVQFAPADGFTGALCLSTSGSGSADITIQWLRPEAIVRAAAL